MRSKWLKNKIQSKKERRSGKVHNWKVDGSPISGRDTIKVDWNHVLNRILVRGSDNLLSLSSRKPTTPLFSAPLSSQTVSRHFFWGVGVDNHQIWLIYLQSICCPYINFSGLWIIKIYNVLVELISTLSKAQHPRKTYCMYNLSFDHIARKRISISSLDHTGQSYGSVFPQNLNFYFILQKPKKKKNPRESMYVQESKQPFFSFIFCIFSDVG